jgi:hypothetical protein
MRARRIRSQRAARDTAHDLRTRRDRKAFDRLLQIEGETPRTLATRT